MPRFLALAVLLFALPAHAVVNIGWVTVGDPGNAADPWASKPGYGMEPIGSVDYAYRISKYEVTNAQYAEFLNAMAALDDPAGLYNTNMGNAFSPNFGGITRSGSEGSYTYSAIARRENMPVNWLSYFDTLRFVNWLHNGQPTGVQDSTTTEDGAYGMQSEPEFPRKTGAKVFLPNLDEWHKAAYFDPFLDGYHEYSMGSDPWVCGFPGATPYTANCCAEVVIDWGPPPTVVCVAPNVGDFTSVGSYTGSPGPYGTFDQGGNVFEWNETPYIVYDTPPIIGPGAGVPRVARGGSFGAPIPFLDHRFVGSSGELNEAEFLGFRVASLAPTPIEIDIKPGSDLNPVNPFALGMIPVAILSSDSFDATVVDVTTLAFGPDGAAPAHKQGGHLKDVNGDGLIDLLSHYRTQETGIASGDTEACVTGETLGGIPFEGCDTINTQPPCGNGYAVALVLPLLWIGGRRRRTRA